MADFELSLGVQSYCFHGFKDNLKVIEGVKDCGLKKIELCGVHADFTKPEEFEPVISLYEKAGIEIFAIGVCLFRNQEKEERKLFEFVKRVGAKVISVTFDINTVPESYRTAERLADQYDINLAIHNHGGGDWLSSVTMLEYVFNHTTSRIGLCLDTAWALDSGENPVEMAKRFANRLYSLHLKDFVFDRAGKPEDVILGKGNLKLKELFKVLKDINFNRPAILEYEGDVDNPVPALKECVKAVFDSAKDLDQ